jgi:hypothetical protein
VIVHPTLTFEAGMVERVAAGEATHDIIVDAPQAHRRKGEDPLPSPEPRRNGRTLRTSAGSAGIVANRASSGDFAASDASDRTPENRGVPGSSPGLAIKENPGNR